MHVTERAELSPIFVNSDLCKKVVLLSIKNKNDVYLYTDPKGNSGMDLSATFRLFENPDAYIIVFEVHSDTEPVMPLMHFMTAATTTNVPEPSTMVFFAVGILDISGIKRKYNS